MGNDECNECMAGQVVFNEVCAGVCGQNDADSCQVYLD